MTLSNVKVGDCITIRSRSSVGIMRVAKVTKAHVITSSGSKFTRSTGRESPRDEWHARDATPTTPADREEIAKLRRRRAVLSACREAHAFLHTDDQVSALHETLVRIGLLKEEP